METTKKTNASDTSQLVTKAKKDKLIAHLSFSYTVVAKWPDWKRQVLGGVPSSNPSRQTSQVTKVVSK